MTVNKVILVGRLGADPEVRTTQAGNTVANLRLATDHNQKIGDEWEKVTDWHRVTVFGKTAENVDRFCRKGKQLYIEGRIQTRKWQDNDGNDRWTTEVIAREVRFLGSKDDDGGGGGTGSGYSGGGGGGSRSSAGSRSGGGGGGGYDGQDDDIPF